MMTQEMQQRLTNSCLSIEGMESLTHLHLRVCFKEQIQKKKKELKK